MNAQVQIRVRRPGAVGDANKWREEKERDRTELRKEFRENPALADRELDDWGRHVVAIDLRSIEPIS